MPRIQLAVRRPRLAHGFTLIELLIVVAIIGIIAAIAIPNLLNAVQRGKQKRTLADMRSVGTAVEAYAVDTSHYVVQPAPAGVSGLSASLVPTYMTTLPVLDGWTNPLTYASDSAGAVFTLSATAKDGVVSGPASGAITDFRHDIVFSSGSFLTWPDGAQE